MLRSGRGTVTFLFLVTALVTIATAQEQQDSNRITAQKLTQEAEALRKAGDGESLRKAIDKFGESTGLWRVAGDSAREADTLFQISAVYRLLGDNRSAIGPLEQALPLKRAVGDNQGVVDTLGLIGSISYTLGDIQKAIGAYQEALPLARKTAYRQGEGRTLTRLGLLFTAIGEYQKAIKEQTEALAVAQAAGDRLGEGGILLNAGWAQQLSGDHQKAFETYRRALTLFQDLSQHPSDLQKVNNIRAGEGQALENIGAIYDEMGDSESALQWFGRALSLYRTGGNRQQEARMLSNMGAVHLSLGKNLKASELFSQALEFARQAGDRANEGETLQNLADLSRRMGNKTQALDYATQALSILRAAGTPRGQANAYIQIGSIHYQLGDAAEAAENYSRALELTLRLKYASGEAHALAGLARIDSDSGRLDAARERMEAALLLIESVRSSVAMHDLRSSYLASTHDEYEFYIDLLMNLHLLRPSGGFNALALQATERARARSLLELLAEAHADVRRGVDPALLERERLLQQRLDATAERYAAVLSSTNTKDQATVILSDVEAQSAELEETEGQIRSMSPRYATLTQPRPLSVREIQEEVLDPDTLLLEYALNTERSYLWVVTKTTLRSYELPPRAVIENAAHRVYDLVTARQPKPGKIPLNRVRLNEMDTQYSSEAAALSMLLLGPVQHDLGTKRLLIVSDGALQYVPFSALPVPGTVKVDHSGTPLIGEHEVVSMPSASTLGVLRQETAHRKPAAKGIAVFADPVFDADDARVQQSFSRTAAPAPNDLLLSGLKRATRSVEITNSRGGFGRLAFSRREAAEILNAAPAGGVMQAFDFQASRKAATSAALSDYRIIHFATHGILDSEHPELSGIVLSLVDRNGAPQDGILRLHDLYNLNLPAELVVLSACQTALGKDIKGEGLIGLTRGFMYAGTPRVIATLWKVDDAATAELMKDFYQGLLGNQHLSPASALQAAQRTISQQKQWASPYYWAAFVLQGDWNGWQTR
jgi:CHAT domain-containing protein/Tfp pilus assembly protein PilF